MNIKPKNYEIGDGSSPIRTPRLSSDVICQRRKLLSRGAIPKRPKSAGKSSLGMETDSRNELEIMFSKMRSKNSGGPMPNTPKKSPELCQNRPKKSPIHSPTKILFKYKKSPTTIMKDLKSKLDGNKVKNIVKRIESGQALNTPKSAKKKVNRSIKKSAVKSKRRPSISLDQPKIDTFLRKEDK